MDGHAGTHLTKDDTNQNPMVDSFPVAHADEPGKDALNEVSALNVLDPSPDNENSGYIVDNVDVEANEEQSSIHLSKSNQEHQEHLDNQSMGSEIDHVHNHVHPQANSSQISLPTLCDEPSSTHPDVPAVESTSAISVNDSDASTAIYHRESPQLYARAVSPTIAALGEREAEPDGCLNHIQMPHTRLDHEHNSNPVRLVDKEGTPEDFDYNNFSSSLPPSSSPPQFLSSSPYASSQSSIIHAESSKMPQVDGCGSPHDYPCSDHQGEFDLGSENTHNPATASAARSKSQMNSTSYADDGLGRSRKRFACQSDSDDSYKSPPNKHPKPDPCLYVPPAPKRATLVSHHRQFKKLAAPFRPPSKLPVVQVETARTINNKEAEIGPTPDSGNDKTDTKPFNTRSPFRNKVSNTLPPATQFKSPLVNKDLPAESHTIRLTPAVQALERKLQLLKRAIKVKEGGEEDILVTLVGKWIEAGREVAYDVWDATKEAADFEGKGKMALVCKSYGWNSTDNGGTSWGWDTKSEGVNEESCGLEPLAGGRPPIEEEEEDCHNTLGTMLRQLGIAPEIFGWDDDAETFSG